MKITHPKDFKIFVNISACPIHPGQLELKFAESKSCYSMPDFEKMFEPGGMLIPDLITVLTSAARQGYTHFEFNDIEYDYINEAVFLKKGPSNEQIAEHESTMQKYSEDFAKWSNELIEAQNAVQIMYERKQKLKEEREKAKTSDPRYIEYLRIQRELREAGYL